MMPYSTGCTTPLSNFEAGLNYKDVPDPAVKVSFPLDDDEDAAEMVIWTTTPWYAIHICTLDWKTCHAARCYVTGDGQ